MEAVKIIKIGETIPNPQTLDLFPVGTAVSSRNRDHHHGRKIWTKHHDGWGTHQSATTRSRASDVWFEGQMLLSLPFFEYAGPQVGEYVDSFEKYQMLPIGSVVADPNGGEEYQRTERDTWYDVARGYNRTLPDVPLNKVVKVLAEVPTETLDQFKWRFRDLAITGSERAVGTAGNANAVLSLIGEGVEEFRPSVGLTLLNQQDRAHLPEGTRIYVGHAEKLATFGVFVRTNGDWTHAFGDQKELPDLRPVVVDGLPGTNEPDLWVTAMPTAEDAEKIAALRAKAWRLGYAEKRSRGWCDEFERIMLRAGVSAESLNPPFPHGKKEGDTVTQEQCAALPLGTHLLWRDGDDWAAFKRVQNATNKWGTARVYSTKEGVGHFHEGMTISSRDILCVRVTTEAQLNAAPIGTKIMDTRGGVPQGTGYVKYADGRWDIARNGGMEVGRHRADAFAVANNNWSFVEMGT